jgi:hypothetical protein
METNLSKEVSEAFQVKQTFRFDIFKGEIDAEGKVRRVRSVGASHIIQGCKTYTVHLKTFLNDVFYLLPEEKKYTSADFLIYTREDSKLPNRKYYWNLVGEGKILDGENSGFMKLSFDVLGGDSIYMNLHPRETTLAEKN